MTATLIPAPRAHPTPPPWLADADPRDGIRVRVDGATTLHTGQLAEPSYRVDVLTEDCLLELACGPALLRFACRPDGDGESPERPGRDSAGASRRPAPASSGRCRSAPARCCGRARATARRPRRSPRSPPGSPRRLSCARC